MLVSNVFSNPSPKKKQIFDSNFLKTGVTKETQCKSELSNYIKERDELLKKVKDLQKKINPLQCKQDEKIGAFQGENICDFLRTVLNGEPYMFWVMGQFNQFAFCEF